MGDFKPMSSLDEDQFMSGDRHGPVDSARKSAATKPISRAHARANRFPMRFYLIAVCVVVLRCHPVCASGNPTCPCCQLRASRIHKCPVCDKKGVVTPQKYQQYMDRHSDVAKRTANGYSEPAGEKTRTFTRC